MLLPPPPPPPSTYNPSSGGTTSTHRHSPPINFLRAPSDFQPLATLLPAACSPHQEPSTGRRLRPPNCALMPGHCCCHCCYLCCFLVPSQISLPPPPPPPDYPLPYSHPHNQPLACFLFSITPSLLVSFSGSSYSPLRRRLCPSSLPYFHRFFPRPRRILVLLLPVMLRTWKSFPLSVPPRAHVATCTCFFLRFGCSVDRFAASLLPAPRCPRYQVTSLVRATSGLS